MSVQEILVNGGGALVILMTLVQIAPIKVNPWSAVGKVLGSIGKAIGKALNGAVIEKLDKMEAIQAETRERLDNHIRMDDERNADMHRASILRFNEELIGDLPHTEEHFNEVLHYIDCYERYCEAHPEYPNNRAVRAIRNIKRVYDERMEKHDFL